MGIYESSYIGPNFADLKIGILHDALNAKRAGRALSANLLNELIPLGLYDNSIKSYADFYRKLGYLNDNDMKMADHATVESMQTAQPTASKIGGFTGGFVKNAALYMVGGE